MKTTLIWILAIVITLVSAVYQRITGPSYPVSGSVDVSGETISYQLLRSHDTTGDAAFAIEVPNGVTGEIRWRRYKSDDDWTTEPLAIGDGALTVRIPLQPTAGKVMYEITLIDAAGNRYELTEEPVIIRYIDPVPSLVLVPHIFFMFIAMLLSTRTGFEAIFKRPGLQLLSIWTAILLFVGGLVLGPVVQKYAFGDYWTGWPFGQDLTDNKTLVAFVFWAIAAFRAHKAGKGRTWVIVAAAVTLIVFIVPHSVLGSEIDYRQISE
jgi:hypothetical protein